MSFILTRINLAIRKLRSFSVVSAAWPGESQGLLESTDFIFLGVLGVTYLVFLPGFRLGNIKLSKEESRAFGIESDP